jgi:subtilisin family serine protease/N-acetylneuraminic acid mutarotase
MTSTIFRSLALGLLLLVLSGQAWALGPQGPAASIEESDPRQPATSADYVPGEVLVSFKSHLSMRGAGLAVASLNSQSGWTFGADGQAQPAFTVLRTFPRVSDLAARPLLHLQTSLAVEEAVRLLKSDPQVENASPNYRRKADAVPNDSYYAQLWGLPKVGAPALWDQSPLATEVVVADLDSGVDYRHEDLAGNMWTNPGEIADNGLDDDSNGYIDDIHGWDTLNDFDPGNGDPLENGDPMDDNGHGTHTSGTIAAVGNNAKGVVGLTWKWNVKIMALKFLDATGNGDDADAIEAINYILDMQEAGVNVKVVNASWGGAGYNDLLRVAIDTLGTAGILFAASAGNQNMNADDKPHYPGGYDLPNIITVAASDPDDAKAGYSNFGRTVVDIAAPGGHYVDGADNSSILSTVPGSYVDTTTATPVAGQTVDDVEAGEGSWIPDTDSPWQRLEGNSNSGDWAWSDGSAGQYPVNRDDSLVSPAINLSGVTGNVQVGFYAAIDLQSEHDYLYIEFSGDDGASWETVISFTGYWDWLNYGYHVPERLRTEYFKYRFRFVSDNVTDNDNPSDGVFLDDIGLVTYTAGKESEGYEGYRGTSMATPHVAATAAVLMAEHTTDEPIDVISRILGGVDTPATLTKLVATGRLRADTAYATANTKPVITGLTPTAGLKTGSQVTITGEFFGSTAGQVQFGGVAASIVSWTNTQIVCKLPANAGRYVKVQRSGGLWSAERWVSAWSVLGTSSNMPLQRNNFASATYNGKIYVFGGYVEDTSNPGTFLASDRVDVFDPATGLWTNRTAMPTPRAMAAAAADSSGNIYVFGGYDPDMKHNVNIVEIYNTISNTWSGTTYTMPGVYGSYGASMLCAVSVGNIIYLTGGSDDAGLAIATAYSFNAGAWTAMNDLATARYGHAMAVVGGKLYVFGGRNGTTILDSVEVMASVPGGAWASAGTLPTPLARMAVATDGKYVYLAGGTGAIPDSHWWDEVGRLLLRFDPTGNTWTPAAASLTESLNHASIARNAGGLAYIKGKGLYAFGGSWDVQTLNQIEKLAMGGAPNLVPVRSLLLGN